MHGFPGVGATKRALLRELQARFQDLQCPGCRSALPSGALTKHHVTPRRDGGPTVLSNLILLCRPCHDVLHRSRGSAVERRVDDFIAQRARGAFPPPADPLTAEEVVALFLSRIAAMTPRVLNAQRFRANPPYDPMWPVGRHFSPVADDGLLRFPLPAT